MERPAVRPPIPLAAIGALIALSGCAGWPQDGKTGPDFIAGPILATRYDGIADDLLTGGLGKSGLMAAAPTFADPAAPTTAELRRNAIHTNYRALVDYTDAGGFGRLFGPNIDREGRDTLGEGLVPGVEYIAVADDGSGRQNVTLMVQVPDSFDTANPCIVTGTSSGSRGIYGAIGTAGEWGLKRGCAVAYTDKGTGNGLHDLTSDKANLIDGRLSADRTGPSIFRAPLDERERAAFNAAWPQRVAFKHAHSQQNPEQQWGRDTLNAIRLAFHVLNERHAGSRAADANGPAFTPGNTLVIASSVSNGGGAALAAAEQDDEGLIDGVAVSEPNAQPRDTQRLTIRQGDATVSSHGRALADYFTYANLYQPCAILAPEAGLSLHATLWPEAFTTAAVQRCAALRARGLLQGDTLAAQAADALGRLHAYGWTSEHDFLQQSHFRFATHSIALTYVSAYGRFGVGERICGYSFANTDAGGAVTPQLPLVQAAIFATGNGIPPTSGVNIVYDEAPGRPTLDFLAASPTSGNADFALDGALCLRALVTGRDEASGTPLAGAAAARSRRVQKGMRSVLLSARLRGKPALIVAGRSDALIPVNHGARAYVGQALINDGADAPLRYVEVTHAQHFDAFIALGAALGYDTRFVPLHRYFGQALDAMYAHLKDGAPLPPSQLVRTRPRNNGEPLADAHMPPISGTPNADNLILFDAGTLQLPD